MGIWDILFLDALNDGAHGTKSKIQEQPMTRMRINRDQTWKYSGKPHKEKCAHNDFYGNITDNTEHLRTLGEMGVIQNYYQRKSQAKR